MKNLAVICLLLIYITSQVGSLLIFYHRPVVHAFSIYRQQRRMRDQKEVIRDTVLSRKAYVASLHEDGEIILNGILHDIKEITYKNEFVHLKLLEDKKETNWLNSLARIANALQHQHPKKWPLQLWSWLFKIYPCDPNNSFHLATLNSLTIRNRGMNESPLSCYLASPGQPPEWIS